LVAGLHRVHIEDQQPGAVEAGVDVRQFVKTGGEQDRARNQDQRQRDLQRRQAAAGQAAHGRGFRGAVTLLDGGQDFAARGPQSRHHSTQDRRNHRDGGDKGQQLRVKAEVQCNGVAGRHQRQQCLRHGPANQHSQRAARQGKQNTLGENLACDAQPAGANGEPHGELFPPLGYAGRLQIHQVHRSQQKHEGHHGEDDVQRLRKPEPQSGNPLRGGYERNLGLAHFRADPLRDISRALELDLDQDGRQRGGSLCRGNAGPQTAQEVEEIRIPIVQPIPSRIDAAERGQRRPHIRRAAHLHSEEIRRGHADNGEGRPLDMNGFADGGRVGAVLPHPQAVTDHGTRHWLAAIVVVRTDFAAQQRVHAEEGEIVSGDQLHARAHRAAAEVDLAPVGSGALAWILQFAKFWATVG